jgi:hypothetical protein
MIAVERGEWERALEFFRASDKQVSALSVGARCRFRRRLGGSRAPHQ